MRWGDEVHSWQCDVRARPDEDPPIGRQETEGGDGEVVGVGGLLHTPRPTLSRSSSSSSSSSFDAEIFEILVHQTTEPQTKQ